MFVSIFLMYDSLVEIFLYIIYPMTKSYSQKKQICFFSFLFNNIKTMFAFDMFSRTKIRKIHNKHRMSVSI